MDLREQRPGVGDDHWYAAARTDLFSGLIDRHARPTTGTIIVDLGAGDGGVSRGVLARARGGAPEVWAVDPAWTDRDLAQRDGLRRSRAFPEEVQPDVLLLTDVVEHVEDDLTLLRDAASRCRPGAVVLLSAPLHSWLWSHHDRALGHLRRYTMSSLRTLATDAGLTLQESGPVFATLLPPAYLVRRVFAALRSGPTDSSDLRPTPAPISWLLRAALRMEAHVPLGSLPIGLTGVVVARVSRTTCS